jgi:signal peptidase I
MPCTRHAAPILRYKYPVPDPVTSLFDPAPADAPAPRPWLAGLLSAVVPGTGQLYVGRPLRALLISTLAVAWPALVLLIVTPLGTAAARLAAMTMGLLLLVICPALDAWHLAHTAPRGPAAWGRWYVLSAWVVFVLFALRPYAIAPAMTRFVQVYQVDGPAMSLTLQAGDRVVTTPLRGPIRPRMVVVWRTPAGASVTHRIVGMPGDRLEMRNFMLLVNGLDVEGAALRPARWATRPGEEFAWQRKFLTDDVAPDRYRPTYGDWGPIRVPPDHYFLLGDNRYGSRDSRQYGFITRDLVVARVRWVFVAFDPTTHDPRLDRMGRDVP